MTAGTLNAAMMAHESTTSARADVRAGVARRTRRAVFLDRDGTLVHPYHYPSRPEHLRLYEGIAEPLRALQAAGLALVVVTNQSGIARGYFTPADLDRMHLALRQSLGSQGVTLDAIEYCPHHPDGVVPPLAIRCGCRKPAPGMLLRAADALHIDLARSWMVGDILDDIEAGRRAGCRSVLVDIGTESTPQRPERWPHAVGRDTRHALALILGAEGLGPQAPVYWPERWRAMPPAAEAAPQLAQLAREGGDESGAKPGGSHGRTR